MVSENKKKKMPNKKNNKMKLVTRTNNTLNDWKSLQNHIKFTPTMTN